MVNKILKGFGIMFIIIIAIGMLADSGDYTDSSSGSGTVSSAKKSFEVLDSRFEREEYTSYIKGTIINNTNKNYGYVQVEINTYDKSGNLVGSTLDNINNLGPGKKWAFKALVFDEDNVATYEIMDVTGF